MSRHHARLDIEVKSYSLTDLGSSNGTWVNGRRIDSPMTLQAGDAVGLGGESLFIFATQAPLESDKTFVEQYIEPKSRQKSPLPEASPIPVTPSQPQSPLGGGPVCAACGTANRPNVRFCEKCGQSLSRVQIGTAAPSVTPVATALRWAVYALAVLVVLSAGLAGLLLLNPGNIRNLNVRLSEPEQAVAMGNQFVAAQHPDYIGLDPQLMPAADQGRRVFGLQYVRIGDDGATDT